MLDIEKDNQLATCLSLSSREDIIGYPAYQLSAILTYFLEFRFLWIIFQQIESWIYEMFDENFHDPYLE